MNTFSRIPGETPVLRMDDFDPTKPVLINGILYEPRTVRDDFERECG